VCGCSYVGKRRSQVDPKRFDEISKGLAAATSRRNLVKGLGGGILGGALALVGHSHAGAKPARVGICHHTGNRNIPVVYEEVSASTAAVLLSRGDTLPGTVTDCSYCGDACTSNDACFTAVCEGGSCGLAPVCAEGAACLDGECFTQYPNCTSSYGVVSNGGGVNACICGSGTFDVCETSGQCPDGQVCILIPNGDDSYTGHCYTGCPA
jgi:hypothetical protein